MPPDPIDPASSGVSRPMRWWSAAMFGALLVLLGTWVVGVPKFGAPDEVAHTSKAYAVAHGQWTGTPIDGESPLTRNVRVPISLVSAQPCFAFQPEVSAGCAVPDSNPALRDYGSTAATYPPAYYLVVGGAARLLGTDTSARSYRLYSLVVFAALMCAAFAVLWRRFGRTAGLVLIACPPMVVFLGASVNPTTVEIAGTLLVWSLLATYLAQPAPATRRQLLTVSVIAAAVVLVRPVALPWIGVAAGVYLVLERRALAANRRELVRLTAAVGAPLAVAAIASSAWSRYAGVGLTDDKFVSTDATTTIAQAAAGRTATLLRQAFGQLGWLDTQLPTTTFAIWLVCLIALGTTLWFGAGAVHRRLLLGITAVWVGYPLVYVVAAHTPSVWQGRYNLPLLGGVMLVALAATKVPGVAPQLSRLATFIAWSWVLIESLAFHQALRRFMVGANGDILLRNPGWWPRADAWFLIAANAVAAVAVAWLLTRARSRQPLDQAAPTDRAAQAA